MSKSMARESATLIALKEYWGVVWSKGTTNKGTGKSIWTYILRGGDLIVKFPKIITKVTFGEGLIF